MPERAGFLLKLLAILSLLFSGAMFGFFFAWVCSTMWGLDAADPNVAIAAMQAMNASVRNWVFAPAFFGTPVLLMFTALAAVRAGSGGPRPASRSPASSMCWRDGSDDDRQCAVERGTGAGGGRRSALRKPAMRGGPIPGPGRYGTPFAPWPPASSSRWRAGASGAQAPFRSGAPANEPDAGHMCHAPAAVVFPTLAAMPLVTSLITVLSLTKP